MCDRCGHTGPYAGSSNMLVDEHERKWIMKMGGWKFCKCGHEQKTGTFCASCGRDFKSMKQIKYNVDKDIYYVYMECIMDEPKTGLRMMVEERHNQMKHYGYTRAHDVEHGEGYIASVILEKLQIEIPWKRMTREDWVELGTLCAAEIDRINRVPDRG